MTSYPYYLQNGMYDDDEERDAPCVFLQENQIKLLKEGRPIFVKRTNMCDLEIHCTAFGHTNKTIYDSNDVLNLTEKDLDEIDNHLAVVSFTKKNEKLFVLKDMNNS